MQLLMKGNQQRTQEPTAANQTSSRSHAVLQVAVRQRSRVRSIVQEVRQGRLFMIDLAGSERASQVRLALGDRAGMSVPEESAPPWEAGSLGLGERLLCGTAPQKLRGKNVQEQWRGEWEPQGADKRGVPEG